MFLWTQEISHYGCSLFCLLFLFVVVYSPRVIHKPGCGACQGFHSLVAVIDHVLTRGYALTCVGFSVVLIPVLNGDVLLSGHGIHTLFFGIAVIARGCTLQLWHPHTPSSTQRWHDLWYSPDPRQYMGGTREWTMTSHWLSGHLELLNYDAHSPKTHCNGKGRV